MIKSRQSTICLSQMLHGLVAMAKEKQRNTELQMEALGRIGLYRCKAFFQRVRSVAKDLDLVPVSNQRAAQLLHGTSVTILFFDHQNLQVDHTIPPLES